jgi:Rrf2 family protein
VYLRDTHSVRLELTRRADYAVRAMLALAAPDEPGLQSVRHIAQRMSIPPRFLPQVMRDLTAAGLVEAQPGRRGGYRLTRTVDQVSLLDIIEASEGDTRRQTCVLRGGPCGRDGYCAVHPVFADAQDAVMTQLDRASLGDVAEIFGTFGQGAIGGRSADDGDAPLTPGLVAGPEAG